MNLYHVLNRGVDKREIFLNKADYARFVHDMHEFNDVRPAGDTYRTIGTTRDLRSPAEKIVDIHGWCLMKNHYHLLLSERAEGGITLFLRKLNIGYAKYFNERYERSGTLFQGRTKKILIERDAHFLHILHYIHLNPLDYLTSARRWRERTIRSPHAAHAHLEQYPWSSYADYCGRSNYPSLLTATLFKEVFEDYTDTVTSYLKSIEDEGFAKLRLE